MTDAEVEVLENEDTQKDKYLTFHIGGEDYAISIRHVIEIIGMLKITEVPQTPHYIKGVINLRGKVIPVMDVRLRFGMPPRDYDERTCVIVVNYNENVVGFVVDTVSEVLDIPAENVENCNHIAGNDNKHFICGMGKVEDRIKMVLDVNALLFKDNEMIEQLLEGEE